MTEAIMCCGTTCDKSKLRSEQQRVVNAFDEFDRRQGAFGPDSQDVDGLEKAFEELRAAVACLRE